MSKIKVQSGTSIGANIQEQHLVTNHLVNQNNIDAIIHYAEKRYLMTFFVSGVTDPRYTATGYINPKEGAKVTASTFNNVKNVPAGELVDGSAWKYKVMGRIQKASIILNQLGTTTAATNTKGSTFTLLMKDRLLQYRNVVRFANGKMATVNSHAQGGDGGYTYIFESFAGEQFDYASWVGIQSGTKTCFAGYTSFGEGSQRGFGNTFFGEMFINHMTLQRKGFDITGDANTSDARWYEAGSVKGFVYEAEAQARAQFLLEDDFAKMYGKSNMRDSLGNLMTVGSSTDPETGLPITSGDGWLEQVKGANDSTSSGFNGNPTLYDFQDMVTAIKKNADDTSAKVYYVRTGVAGFIAAHNVIQDFGANTYRITQNLDGNEVGGASPEVGYNFSRLNISGNQLIFVEDPQMSDEQKFPMKLKDGRGVEEMTYYFMDASPDGTGGRNLSIYVKGRGNINRNMVYWTQNGMTGEPGATSSVDAKQIQFLKQNMLVVKRTNTSGILTPPLTA